MEQVKLSKAVEYYQSPSYCEAKLHHHGNIAMASEYATFDINIRDFLLIVPFYHPYGTPNYSTLIWNPQTLKLLNRLPGHISGVWRLWNNYETLVREDSENLQQTVLWIYTRTKRGLRKLKRAYVFPSLRPSIVGILVSNLFKNIYIIGTLSFHILDKRFRVRSSHTLDKHIIKAFVCEDSNTFVTCSWKSISIYQLNDKGYLKKPNAFEIKFEHEFANACLENRQLTVITIKYNKVIGVSVYISKIHLADEGSRYLEKDTHLIDLPTTGYTFNFLPGNKTIVCSHRYGSGFTIVSLTGQLLFKSFEKAAFLTVDLKERALFTTSFNVLEKSVFDENSFLKQV